MTVKKIAAAEVMNGIVHVQRIGFLVNVNRMKMKMFVWVTVRATDKEVVILFVIVLFEHLFVA